VPVVLKLILPYPISHDLLSQFSKVIPTIKSVEPYNRLQQWADAKAIHAALKTGIAGIGCDWKPVIDILANRTNKQRQQIAQIFDQVHAKVPQCYKNYLNFRLVESLKI
jgi:hypothetical protein